MQDPPSSGSAQDFLQLDHSLVISKGIEGKTPLILNPNFLGLSVCRLQIKSLTNRVNMFFFSPVLSFSFSQFLGDLCNY